METKAGAPAANKRTEEDGVDRISHLPDDILGEIVSLLPIEDAARTQTLASRWRRIWHSVPLDLDHSRLSLHYGEQVLASLISCILASYRGPARRLSFPVLHLHRCPATVDAWLRSPALDSLQELELDIGGPLYSLARDLPLPRSAFRFSATLRVATIRKCRVPDGAVDALRFPQLRQRGLDDVEISEGSLHSIIAGCPVLECLLLRGWCCFRCIRIKSPSLVSIALSVYCGELIIEDAPSLERLLQLEFRTATTVSVISAPKLDLELPW